MPSSRSPKSGEVLYVSYDGMTDPLGRAQVLPYLVGLAARGHRITLLSLDKPDRLQAGLAEVQAICDAAGIDWHPLTYFKRPPILAGQLNVCRLGRRARALHRQRRFAFVHARSDLSALAARPLWDGGGAKLLYDMRALWPDERVEGGSWPQDRWIYRRIFRTFKVHQQHFLDRADAIVVLTERGWQIVLDWPGRTGTAPVSVIPCCADFDAFRLPTREQRAAARASLGLAAEAPVMTYLGSVGTWYMLDEMLDTFTAWRAGRPGAVLLIITPDDPAPILAAAKARLVADALVVRSGTREQVPTFLAAADLGIFYILPVFSKQASSPTKMGELMACGLPVLCNSGVGDVDRIIAETGAGVAVKAFDMDSLMDAFAILDTLPVEPTTIRERARKWFDVATGIDRYDAIYRGLLADRE